MMQKQYSIIGLLFIFMLVFSCNKNDVEEGSQPIGKRISFSTNMGDDFDDLKNTKGSTSNEEEIVYQDAALTITSSPMKIRKAVSTRGALIDSADVVEFMVYGYSHEGDFANATELQLAFGPLSITKDSKWMNDAAIWAGDGRKMSFFAYVMTENKYDGITINQSQAIFPTIGYALTANSEKGHINQAIDQTDILVATAYDKSVGDTVRLELKHIFSTLSVKLTGEAPSKKFKTTKFKALIQYEGSYGDGWVLEDDIGWKDIEIGMEIKKGDFIDGVFKSLEADNVMVLPQTITNHDGHSEDEPRIVTGYSVGSDDTGENHADFPTMEFKAGMHYTFSIKIEENKP